MITMHLHLMFRWMNKLCIFNKRKPNRWSTVDNSQSSGDHAQDNNHTFSWYIDHSVNILSASLDNLSVNSFTESDTDISANNIQLTQTIAWTLHASPRNASGLFSSSVVTHQSVSSTPPSNATTTWNRHWYNLRVTQGGYRSQEKKLPNFSLISLSIFFRFPWFSSLII